MRKCRRFFVASVLSVLSVILTAGVAAGADWPQFQGPGRDGISRETGLAREWPEKGPKKLWTTGVGPGYGGPAVRDDEVYFLDREEAERDILRCLDLKSGEELWRYAYDAPGETGHSGSRTAPAVTADRVYTVGLMGDFLSIDRKTHKPVWHKNLLKDFGAGVPTWGVAQSPLLYKNMVIVAPQADDAFVVAYDKESGELLWKSEDLGAVGYSSPVIANLCGMDQVLMISATPKDGSEEGGVAALSPEDGSVLWRYTDWNCRIPIPYPMALPENRVFVTGGYDAGSVMLKLTRDGDAFSVTPLFTLSAEECGSQIHQPLLCKDHLYLNSNSNEREDGMMCMTLDGKILWKTSEKNFLPGFERGNLILVDNMIINQEGRRGTLHLVAPKPAGYQELARARVHKGKKAWAPMAFSQGCVIMRDQETMTCLNLRNP
jgi:outer membrane protein assembly factor BamB